MEQISTDAGESKLPFSDAIRHGETIYVSGQGPIDPESGDIVGEDVQEQAVRTLENVDRILEAGGSSLETVVKVTVYLDDMDDYEAFNETYADYLTEPYPARTAVEVVDHPVDIDVELDVIATTS